MKLYRIKKGTVATLITNFGTHHMEMREFATRKQLDFMDTITDPIREYNRRSVTVPRSSLELLALDGYFIFGGEYGSDMSAKYILAVRDKDVEVL